VSEIGFVPLGPPPEISSLGEKTYKAVMRFQNDLDSVKSRDWRHIPYALWLSNNRGLIFESEIITRYYEEEIPAIIKQARRPFKWGRPMLFVYVAQFDPNDPNFCKFAIHAKHFFDAERMSLASSIVAFCRRISFFDIEEGPKKQPNQFWHLKGAIVSGLWKMNYGKGSRVAHLQSRYFIHF